MYTCALYNLEHLLGCAIDRNVWLDVQGMHSWWAVDEHISLRKQVRSACSGTRWAPKFHNLTLCDATSYLLIYLATITRAATKQLSGEQLAADRSEEVVVQQLLEFLDFYGGVVNFSMLGAFQQRFPAAKPVMGGMKRDQVRAFCSKHEQISFVPDGNAPHGAWIRRTGRAAFDV